MLLPDITALIAPVSLEAPCGPDLVEAGDAVFMNYLTHAEGLLPASFFFVRDDRSQPFDRNSVDFKGEFAAARPWLEATRDLRLLNLQAKFHLLNRDLSGFVQHVSAIAALLEAQWELVHPRGEGGDYAMRMAELQSLDDMAPVVLPLQHVPLLKPARGQPVAFRAHLVASGEVVAREGEEQPDQNAIDRTIRDVEVGQLVEVRDLLAALLAALTTIRNVFVEKVGFQNAIKHVRLPALIDKMLVFVNGALARRDPSLATAAAQGAQATAGEETGAEKVLAMSTVNEVAAALEAIEGFFLRDEPSSPVLLLVRQARQLIGKSFLEAMQVLVPDFVERAALELGRTDSFTVPLQRFSEFAHVAEVSPELSPGKPSPEVRSRQTVTGLLTEIGRFYSQREPSSPIPFLTDRARQLIGRDFLSILKDILPENTLRGPG